MRRAVAIAAIAVGLALVAVPIGYALFGRTGDAERILDRFEFFTLGDAPARYLDEAEVTREGSTELVDEAIPGLAADAGVSSSQLETRFPALADDRAKIAEAEDFSIRYSEQLEAVDEKFEPVYDIPIAELPLTATPWLFVLGGLAFLGLGVVTLMTSGRFALVAILVLGVVTVLGLLALSAPGKAADGEDVKDFAGNGLSERAVATARDASTGLDSVVVETDEQVLPFLAERAGISQAEMDQQLGDRFPASARLLAEWDEIGPHLARLADAVSASTEEFESAEKMPIAFPVWLLLGAGVGLSLLAGIALLQGRR